MRPSFALLALLSAVIAAACTIETNPGHCRTDKDCMTGYRCNRDSKAPTDQVLRCTCMSPEVMLVNHE